MDIAPIVRLLLRPSPRDPVVRFIASALACVLCLAVVVGCGTLRPAGEGRGPSSFAEVRDDIRAEFTDAWQKSRRRARQAVGEIRQDLEFHESEGLDSFGGGATEQVKQMRAEMDATKL
jgi:hypothetical protein